MVSDNHLSAGNSLSSPSRDLHAEFGVLGPNSLYMAESEPNPLVLAPISDDSSSNEDMEVSALDRGSDMQDIFRAARYFTQKDRMDAVDERKKNQDLIDFLYAKGFSIQDVNAFVRSCSSSGTDHAHHLFDKSSHPAVVHVSSPASSAAPTGLLQEGFPPLVPPSSALGYDLEEGELLPLHPSANVDRVADLPSKSDSAVNLPIRFWSSVVAQGVHKASFSLDFFPPPSPSSDNGPITIKPPAEFLKQGNSLWQSCLIGGFLHSRLPFKLVADNVHKMWDKYGLQKVFLQDKGLFVFKFAMAEERDNVLALGPWYISNKLLIRSLVYLE